MTNAAVWIEVGSACSSFPNQYWLSSKKKIYIYTFFIHITTIHIHRVMYLCEQSLCDCGNYAEGTLTHLLLEVTKFDFTTFRPFSSIFSHCLLHIYHCANCWLYIIRCHLYELIVLHTVYVTVTLKCLY